MKLSLSFSGYEIQFSKNNAKEMFKNGVIRVSEKINKMCGPQRDFKSV
jgi:hypothetical protein